MLKFCCLPCYLPSIRPIFLWLSFFLLFKYPVWPNPESIDPKEKREANISQGRNAIFLMACHVSCLLVPSHSRRVNLLDFLTLWASAAAMHDYFKWDLKKIMIFKLLELSEEDRS